MMQPEPDREAVARWVAYCARPKRRPMWWFTGQPEYLTTP